MQPFACLFIWSIHDDFVGGLLASLFPNHRISRNPQASMFHWFLSLYMQLVFYVTGFPFCLFISRLSEFVLKLAGEEGLLLVSQNFLLTFPPRKLPISHKRVNLTKRKKTRPTYHSFCNCEVYCIELNRWG